MRYSTTHYCTPSLDSHMALICGTGVLPRGHLLQQGHSQNSNDGHSLPAHMQDTKKRKARQTTRKYPVPLSRHILPHILM